MSLCIFPGTFNPIHNGHIYMANYVLENFGVKKVVFIPSHIPPQKTNAPELAVHRYNMVQKAIESNSSFELSDIEYRMSGKSYTYLTLLELRRIYDIDDRIFFIIGTDAFEKLDSWYESEKLRQLVHFIVFVREDNFSEAKYSKMRDKGYVFTFAKMQFNDISSTDIRTKIFNGQSIEGLVPKLEERYILENELYKN